VQTNIQNMPPFVRFQVMAVEDRSRLLESGHYGFKNVEMAYITRPGQRDTVVKEAELWLADLEKQVRDERVPREWLGHFRKQYEMWKAGLEVPVEGTPIRGWPVIFPAQQEELLSIGIRTVEDLAAANMEIVNRIGLGGMDLKKKAEAWLATSAGAGVAVSRIEALERDNQALREKVEELSRALSDNKLPAKAVPSL